MPAYVYKCSICHNTRTVIHGMNEDREELCRCDTVMHRVPQPFAVNWNGNPPSVGTHPLVEQFNATYDERKAAFAERKYKHEQSQN